MSTVIAFERPARRSGPPPLPPAERGPAQVLLFTGVRYERLELRETAPGRDTGGQFGTIHRP